MWSTAQLKESFSVDPILSPDDVGAPYDVEGQLSLVESVTSYLVVSRERVSARRPELLQIPSRQSVIRY